MQYWKLCSMAVYYICHPKNKTPTVFVIKNIKQGQGQNELQV